MERPSCGTCPYWHVVDAYSGQCRHRPPALLASLAQYDDQSWNAAWPQVAPRDWCGCHPDFPAWIESQKTTPPPPETAETQADS